MVRARSGTRRRWYKIDVTPFLVRRPRALGVPAVATASSHASDEGSDWVAAGRRVDRTTSTRRSDRLESGHRRIFTIGLAMAVGSLWITWVLARYDAFDNIISLLAVGYLLIALTTLGLFPRMADRVAEGTALFVVGYVATKVVHLLFVPHDPLQFALEAAVFVPWGPVIVMMGWVVFGPSVRLFATIAAYYTALLIPGVWWLAFHDSAARGPALAVGGAIFFASAVVTVMLVLLMDLETRHAAAEARSRILQEIAWLDRVTGLPNRRALEDALERETRRSARTRTPLAVILFDLDGFKAINDQKGHSVGDRLLAAVGQRVRSTLRTGDVLGRWGGDEFLAILPDTSRRAAVGLAERVRSALASQKGGSLGTAVTASFGVATFRAGDPIAEPISRADKALYLAKTRGRNRVVGESEMFGARAMVSDEGTVVQTRLQHTSLTRRSPL